MASLNHVAITTDNLGLLSVTELNDKDYKCIPHPNKTHVDMVNGEGGFSYGFHFRTEPNNRTGDVNDRRNPLRIPDGGSFNRDSLQTMMDGMADTFSLESSSLNLDALFHILQDCRAKRDRECAKRAHFHACYIGLEAHILLGNCLIPVLVDCRCFLEAKRVLFKLPIRNEYSWTSLIQGCNEWGESYHAFALFEKMQDEHVHPSIFTFVALLKACAKVKNMKKGRELHIEITKHSYERDPHVGNILIDMYAKCGSLTEAHYIFTSLAIRDVVSWNTMMAAYVDHRYDEEALELLDEMRDADMCPNHVTLICGLKACGNGRALKKGQALHTEIACEGYDSAFNNIGSTLIDMYVKCGLMTEAQDVFDNLGERDAVAWNALIVGYAEHSRGKEVLGFLEKMKAQAMSPDVVALAYGIKACSRIGDIGNGHVIHMESVKHGLETDDLIGSTLIDMYAKLGSVEEAQEVFSKMPSRGIVPWTALIIGYADCGLGEVALTCFRNMQLEGIPANDVTLVCGLKACSSLENSRMGRELHMLAAKAGYERNPFVGAALVDMYAKSGSLGEARASLLRLPSRGVVVWTALIAGYVKEGLGEEALYTMKQMQAEGIVPNEVTFACSLKACSTLGAIESGQELHASIVVEGFEEEPYVGSILVDMYAKCGSVAEAREVFDNLPSRDLSAWNTLMAVYAEHDFPDEALMCFERMQVEGIAPNQVTFVLALKGCGSLRAYNKGQEIVTQITMEGIDKELFICNALVDFYAKCGCLLDAREAFDKLLFKDVVSWTSLITGYVDYGFGEAALDCFMQMKSEGLLPDPGMFVCCLKACGSVGSIVRGQEIHIEVALEGFENDFLVGSSLVDMYAKCGWLVEAQEIFDELPNRDIVSWTALIGGYAEHGHSAKGLSCFQEMQMKGITPDVVSWNNLILGYSEQGDCENAHKFYTQMQEQGLMPNKVTITNHLKACGSTAALKIGRRLVTRIYGEAGIKMVEIIIANAVVDMYGRCGSMSEARKAFNEMPRKQRVTWNGLLTGYARQGEYETVFELLARMVKEERIQPNEVTFLAVLIACNHSGLVKKGKMYFEMMIDDYGLEQTIMHYNCMIDLFGRAGLLNDVVLLLHMMPFEPNDVTWITVLSASQKWSNVSLGRHAFEKLTRGGERNTAALVTMANIYANAHMWDEVKEIEAMSLWRELCSQIS